MGRYFEYQDAKSDKFWYIDLTGSAFVARWGKRGTSGQSKEKAFGSEEEAKKNHDKLIAEKLKEGYREENASAYEAGIAFDPGIAALKAQLEKNLKALGKTEEEILAEQATGAARRTEPTVEAKPVPTVPAVEISAPANSKSARKNTGIGIANAKSLGLRDDELRFAPWRKIPALPKETARPFDLKARRADAAKARLSYYWQEPDWSPCGIPLFMNRDEAEFWFEAVVKPFPNGKFPAFAESLSPRGFLSHLNPTSARQALNLRYASGRDVGPCETGAVVSPLYNLFGVVDTIRVIADAPMGAYTSPARVMAESFRKRVFPYLDETEREEARAELHKLLEPNRFPWPDSDFETPVVHHLAALFGLEEELRPIIDSWEPDRYSDGGKAYTHYNEPQRVIYAFSNPEEVARYFKKLRLAFSLPEHVAGWIAHTECSELDYLWKPCFASRTRTRCPLRPPCSAGSGRARRPCPCCASTRNPWRRRSARSGSRNTPRKR